MEEHMRKKPPDIRTALTKKVTIQNFTMYITVGFYPSDQPCEVFIIVAKEGSTLSGLMDSIAISISFGLQYGVPWIEYRKKMELTQFLPADDKFSSIIDAVVKTVSQLISVKGGIEDKSNSYEMESKDDSIP